MEKKRGTKERLNCDQRYMIILKCIVLHERAAELDRDRVEQGSVS